MAQKSGRLVISPQGNSSLNGIRLAIRGAGNPLREATDFIRGSGFDNNSFITATGSDGFLGNIAVFFITNVAAAVRQPESTFGFEIAEESNERTATAELPQRKQNEINIPDGIDWRREQRKKRILIGVAGGASLVAAIALWIWLKKNSADRR